MDFNQTKLWKKIEENESLKNCIVDIRENCVLLGETIKNLIPGFTDHSVKHMDCLWSITDSVFTPTEIQKFTVAEAFVLGASFYFHDLGMSLAATKEGVQKLKRSEKYIAYYNRSTEFYRLQPEQANVIALQLTARALHAENTIQLCTDPIPGLNKYIIEKEALRNSWANYIGEVSASHHWPLTTIEYKFGARGFIPSPDGGNVDLALIACALRIVDYAHINSDRANYIERLLRLNIDDESLLHWKAQENINGPSRNENKLKYASSKPIEDVEAWWLFYDMALGLDKEISAVGEYLETKAWSRERFSLEGVQNVKTPKTFSSLIRPLNFEPIDIRFKPDSIERLVEILGGKTLYGNDQYAALRELLQNSRDAILLRQDQEKISDDNDYTGKITVSLDNSSSPAKLIIKDNGIGMDSTVIQDYLLGIASDYWNSQDFYNDFPDAKSKGFSPTGKFGIGFLSVFMIGDIIEVETERKGRSNLRLSLKGLGKHGALISSISKANLGTSIAISISKQSLTIYNNLELIVKARTPMLSFPVVIKTPTQTSTIEPGWWKTATQRDFFDFTSRWANVFSQDSLGDEFLRERYFLRRYSRHGENVDFNSVDRFQKWPNKQPEIIDENYRLLAIPDFGRVVLCSRGVAVKTISLSGLTGMANVDDLMLTASRNETIKWNSEEFIDRIKSDIKPKIIIALNDLVEEGMIISRFEFILRVAQIYGEDVLLESLLPWISIIMPPGDVKLFNVEEATKLLGDRDEVILSYGTGPWTTEHICRNYFPSASNSALILPINSTGQPSFGRYSEKDIIVMDILPKQIKSEEEMDNDEESDKYKQATYLTSFLKVLAKAWKINESNLVYSQWLRYKNSHLCGHFKRRDLK